MTRRIALAASMAVVAIVSAFAGASAATTGEKGLTAGRVPPEAFTANGSLDYAVIPDLVIVEDDDGREVGYISKEYLTSGWTPNGNEPQPVVERDGVTVVGHIYPGVGFVRLGEQQAPQVSATTIVEPVETGD